MKVRVSIGNLAPIMSIPMGEVDTYRVVGIMNSGSYAKGEILIQPLGGAAELTEKGRKMLIDRFEAQNFHKNDARFVVDDRHLREIFEIFRRRNDDIFESSPLREIREELSTVEFPENEHFLGAVPPILSAEETAQIFVAFKRTVIQPFSDGPGTSPLAGKLPSRRLFHLFEVELPSYEMYEKILHSPVTRELNRSEIASVNGGRTKGETGLGETIADNFILP